MPTPRPPTSPLAIVLLLAFNALAFFGVAGLIVKVPQGPGRWFMEGGPWMYGLGLLFLAQVSAALLLSLLHQRRPISVLLYLVVPCGVLLVGELARSLGIEQAFGAIAMAAPDQKVAMWSMSLAIADIPRAFAFFILAASGLHLAAGNALAAFVRRRPGQHRALAALAGGLALLAGATTIVLGLTGGPVMGSGGRPLLLGIPLLLCAPLVALAAPGLKGLAGAEEEEERGQAFPLALGLAAGLLLMVGGLALALHSVNRSLVISAVASAGPDSMAAMFTMATNAARLTSPLGLIAVAAAAFAALPILLFSAPAFGSWFGRHPLRAVALGIVLLGGVALDLTAGRHEAGRHAELRATLGAPIVDGLTLPESDSELVPSGYDQLFLLQGNELVPADGAAHRVRPGRERLTLALEASTSGETLRSLGARLRQQGSDGVSLLVGPRETGEGGRSAERRSYLREMGLPGDLFLLADDGRSSISLMLAEEIAEFQSPGEPSLGLMLELSGGRVTISTTASASGAPKEPLPAGKDGSIDREAIARELGKIKDEFPDETLIAIYADDSTSLQQVVDAIDAARSEGPGWGGRMLFTDPLLVSSSARGAPRSDRFEKLLGEMFQAKANSAGDAYGHTAPEDDLPSSAPELPVVMGSLPQEVIVRVVQAQSSRLRFCYARELDRTPDLQGQLQMKFVISATGTVSTAKILESTFNHPALESCLVTKVKTLRFPAPEGGGIVIVSYPFAFKTGD